MVRGTTPLHKFTFPVQILDNYKNMLISYRQNGKIKLQKVLSDLDIDGNVATVKLSQEETLLFEPDNLFIKVKVLTNSGDVQASPTFREVVQDVIDDTILTEDTIADPLLDVKFTDVIIRGTTPIIFYAPKHINIDNFEEAFLNVKQNGELVIQKTINDAEIVNDMFVWVLTQEETISLQPFVMAIATCVWKLKNGKRGESKLMVCKIFNSTQNGVI